MTVVVFGSANVDLVLRVVHHPAPGETVTAIDRPRTQAGGKGVNQAIAARRIGRLPTVFVGAVGEDENAGVVTAALAAAGVDAQLRRMNDVPTGSAFIVLDERGENTIVVVAGANAALTEVTDAERGHLERARVALFQAETPRSGFLRAAAITREHGGRVILNAAPARPLDAEDARVIDVLVVNESESADVAEGLGLDRGLPPGQLSERLAEHFRAVVITLGAQGAVWAESGGRGSATAPAVRAVDTTGAGDTFCGALAAELADGHTLASAVRLAVVAAAIAVTRQGAADAVPDRAEVEALLP